MSKNKLITANDIWFTSDTHFGHDNIIEYCKRPFDNVPEMNKEMINRWNVRVGKNDTVYHLGDIFLKMNSDQANEIMDQLHGHITLVRGNHDSVAEKIQNRFTAIWDAKMIRVADADAYRGQQGIYLHHYACRVWPESHHGSFHLYGHSHGSLPDDPNARSFDVGVDCYGFVPINYAEVKSIMGAKNFQAVDHHK